jgi:hypothetical protein
LFLLAMVIMAALAGASASAQAQSTTPAVVMLMRHAEKPLVGKDENLTPAGYARARALPLLFFLKPGTTIPGIKNGAVPAKLPVPNALFATAPSRHSLRPIETITPLAGYMHLEVQHPFGEADVAAQASEVLSGKYAGKVVLICWHHGELPALAKALGVEHPPAWDAQVFDHVWKIEWVNDKAHLTDIPERLMPGDSDR